MGPRDFKVGQTVYCMPGYRTVNGVREAKPLIPMTVRSVGRKYVTADCGSGALHKYECSTAKSARHLIECGCRWGYLYPSTQDWKIEQEEEELRRTIRKTMDRGNLNACTLGQLRMILHILERGGEIP